MEFKKSIRGGSILCFVTEKNKLGRTSIEYTVRVYKKSREKSSEKIIAAIKENPAISAQQIAQLLGVTSRAIEKHLSKLKEKGIIKRIGPDKGGHWEIHG